MHRIRARYMRGEELKFISHLDLARTFERALNRGEIPVAYTEGYHPHPRISIAAPLAVGITSDDEYADFDLSGDMPAEEFRDRMNRSLPAGLKILEARRIDAGGGSLMSGIGRADYIVSFVPACSEERLEDFVKKVLRADKLLIEKDTNKGAKPVDIRPLIYELEVVEPSGAEAGRNETGEGQASEVEAGQSGAGQGGAGEVEASRAEASQGGAGRAESGQRGASRGEAGVGEKGRAGASKAEAAHGGETELVAGSSDDWEQAEAIDHVREMAKLRMALAAGSRANLRPDLMVGLLARERIADIGKSMPSIHRTALYSLKGKDFVTPFHF